MAVKRKLVPFGVAAVGAVVLGTVANLLNFSDVTLYITGGVFMVALVVWASPYAFPSASPPAD